MLVVGILIVIRLRHGTCACSAATRRPNAHERADGGVSREDTGTGRLT
jgi:hypothetical protein